MTRTLVVLIVLASITGCASMHRAPDGQLTVDAMATPGGVATTIDASGRYTVSAAQAKVIEAQAEMMRACAADPARCPTYGYTNPNGVSPAMFRVNQVASEWRAAAIEVEEIRRIEAEAAARRANEGE